MKKALIDGSKVTLWFRYNEDLISQIKHCFRFRRWDKQRRAWEVIITDRLESETICYILKKYGFIIEEKNPLTFNEVELCSNELRLFPPLFSFSEVEERLERFITFKDEKYRFYRVFLSKTSLELILQLIEKRKLFVEQEVKEKILEEYKNILLEIEKSQLTQANFDVPGLKKELFPFQKAGVQYLVEKGRVLLADEMGLGKTVQSIAAVVYQKALPCLVVCPASLKYNWEKEIIQSTENTVHVVETRKPVDKNADFIIINYDILVNYLDDLKQISFQALIVDESHYIKNENAKRTQAVMEIAEEIKRRDGKIYLLTGTPILNRPEELISQLEVLGTLKMIVRNKLQFRIRYCGGYKDKRGWHFKGASNISELQEKLRSTCMIRRHKKDVLTELPKKFRTVINIEIHDFRYFALEDEYDEAKFEEKIKYIPMLYKQSGISKIPHALEWIENFYKNFSDSQKKLVVFAYHREVQEKLYEKLSRNYNVLKLTADTNTKERHRIAQRFQSDKEVQIIIVAFLIAGEGITLTASDTALFVEPYWVPAKLQQAEDRLHRISQRFSVSVYYLLAQNTIDMAIWNIAFDKETIFRELTKGIELTPRQKEMVEVMDRYLLKKSKEKNPEKGKVTSRLFKV